jgi:hypothetical protein
MAETPENSTWWLPQATSSRNTSRGLFNHRLRRVQSTVLMLPTEDRTIMKSVVIGGRSGDLYFDDWIVV